MIKAVKDILSRHGIEYSGILSASEAVIINKQLWERRVPFARSLIVFVIPYRAAAPAHHNVSLYAAPRDYHGYMRELFARVGTELEGLYPGRRFVGMSDHSPINETRAAACAGLGVIGDNSRLITEKYGSYVFLGEIYTDEDLSGSDFREPSYCVHCGRCRSACPADFGVTCLSEITQRKGGLSDSEIEMMRREGSVWGCDICQEVCPMNADKAFTDIEYFRRDLIYNLDQETLDCMSDDDFAARAFSWRGRAVPQRNIKILGLE